MNKPRYDDERLAALLAGRLEGPERDELLAYLSTTEEDADAVINAAAILREMEEEDAQAAAAAMPGPSEPQREVVPPSVTTKARGWPRRTPRWAIPAIIAGLVVLFIGYRGFQAWSAGRAAPAPGFGEVIASLDPTEQGMPEDLAASPGLYRGGETAAPTPQDAARAGALLVHLAVAVQAREAGDTRLLANQVRVRFDEQGGSALDSISAHAGEPARSLQPFLEQAAVRLEELLQHPDHLRLGAWVEAARIAAARKDAAFFAQDQASDALSRAEELTEGDAQAQTAITAIRGALPAGGTPDWEALGKNLDALLERVVD